MPENRRGWCIENKCDMPHLACPSGCDCDSIHLSEVTVETYPNSVTTDCGGTRLLPGKAGLLGRGSGVRIECWCECGCRFEIRLDFHKGTIFLHHALLAPGVDDASELWRD